jgi:hypothetical protein
VTQQKRQTGDDRVRIRSVELDRRLVRAGGAIGRAQLLGTLSEVDRRARKI